MNSTLRRYKQLLVDYLRPQWRKVSLLTVLLLGGIAMQLINPQIMRTFIDSAVEGGPLRNLTTLALVFIVLAFGQQVMNVGATYYSEAVAWGSTNALRAELAMHCLRLDMPFHNVRTPGEMIERIDHDVTALANFMSQFIVKVLGNLLLLLGILAAFFREDWRAGVVFTLYTAAALTSLNVIRAKAIPLWTDAHQATAELYGFLEERLNGTEDIRSSGATRFVLWGFDGFLGERARLWRKAMWMFFGVFFTLNNFAALGVMVALGVGYFLFSRGEATIGTVVLIVNYTYVMFWPLEQISMQIQDLQRAGAGISRVDELFQIGSDVTGGPGVDFPAGPLAVVFDSVSFNYHDEEVVLQDIALKLEAGRVLGLLGRTGSGKSTLARLLFRLYDPDAGVIRLGGLDIRQATLDGLRRSIGMVTQEVQLFHATIRENLTFFDGGITDERLLEVLEELGLKEWVLGLPDGLDTMLEYGGGGLSAGEAQLVAFTRVFLSDPGLVILDEASSRLDPVTEHLIQQAVDRLLANRTGIIIAHHLATVERADEILILEEGRIKEQGAYRQLADDPNSHFYRLLQTGLAEEVAL